MSTSKKVYQIEYKTGSRVPLSTKRLGAYTAPESRHYARLKYAERDMMESEFTQRASQIPTHGLGLSVDVYQPDLIQLVQRLRQEGLHPGYLEVFKATTAVMNWVRARISDIKLTYHGEGLWVSQPDFIRTYSGRQGAAEACAQVAALGSAWLNHECAAKQMAGYAFGTYVPPLYTALSARMTAQNLACLQERLDKETGEKRGRRSLVLLEMPPLTYFACGSVDIPAFFRLVTEQVACGLVLDIGHVWTVYRYTGAWRTQDLEAFVAAFLDAFPMERVIEIHVAGLAVSPNSLSQAEAGGPSLPYWIDSHGAPIPAILFDVLDQVVAHPRLTSLKGVALEVDTKSIPDIVAEYAPFADRYDSVVQWADSWNAVGVSTLENNQRDSSYRAAEVPATAQAWLDRQYQEYVGLITTAGSVSGNPDLSLLGGSLEDLDRYRRGYLPHELLHWGGELTDMFPETCRLLASADIPLERFISFWFDRQRLPRGDYDFFLLKIDRFVEFVESAGSFASATAIGEANDLRVAYQTANEPFRSEEVHA